MSLPLPKKKGHIIKQKHELNTSLDIIIKPHVVINIYDDEKVGKLTKKCIMN